MSKLRATQLQYKDLLRGTNKIMSTGYFVEKDNSNYVKDNYDVELLQWSNKIIKDSFTKSNDFQCTCCGKLVVKVETTQNKH